MATAASPPLSLALQWPVSQRVLNNFLRLPSFESSVGVKERGRRETERGRGWEEDGKGRERVERKEKQE